MHDDLSAGIAQALLTLNIEAQALGEAHSHFHTQQSALNKALSLILQASAKGGHLVVTGMGKSGHVARKIAATMASTGTPAFFLHPAEASHGDLGMIGIFDVILALSFSGETQELVALLPFFKRHRLALIVICGNARSTLAQAADAQLILAIEKEACPHNLAPTSSTTVQMALGDALALGALVARGFSAEDFARFHPGGALGQRLISVADIMHLGQEVPKVSPQTSLQETLREITRGGLGIAAIVDDREQVMGVFTDGDLRRLMLSQSVEAKIPIHKIMHRHPQTIAHTELAASAVALLEDKKINQLLVVDEHNRLMGAINMHDLLKHRVI